MFPDSAIAEDFKCRRTKATAILKVIAQDIQKKVLCAVSNSKYFSLQTDETTDIMVTQEAAVMLRYFDNSLGKVRCLFYALDKVEEADASNLFDSIDQHFQNSDVLTCDHLIGLGTDGCNVMMGERNSIMSRLRSKQPGLIALHCNCHIAALIANHACLVIPKELEELTTDVWYYFHKSAKRMREFARFQCFVEVKPHKLLKACQTRWLSLEACVNRLIEQYDALLSYFRSTSDTTAAVRRITIVLEKSITKAYLLFLSNALPIINYFNKCMQQQAPLLHVFMQEIEGLVCKLLLRFMKSDYVCKLSTIIGEACLDDEAQYLPLDEVFVGHSTSQYLEEALEDSLSTTDLRNFQKTIRSWWYTCSKEAIKRLPLQNHF